MFQINFHHQSPEVIVKRSRVALEGTFAGVTKGVAVKYVGQGQEQYTVGEQRVCLDAGEFLLLPAGTAYRAQPGAVGQATVGVCIDFLADMPEEAGFDFLYGGTFRVGDLGLGRLAGWEHLSGPSATDGLPPLQEELKAFLAGTIELGAALQPVATNPVTRRELSKSLLAARRYVEKHYTESLSLDQLARIAGLSKYHFARLFKRAFGITPLQLQKELRLQAAARLIRADQGSLTNVAHAIGYTDLATFSRHFRAHFGVAPSKFS